MKGDLLHKRFLSDSHLCLHFLLSTFQRIWFCNTPVMTHGHIHKKAKIETMTDNNGQTALDQKALNKFSRQNAALGKSSFSLPLNFAVSVLYFFSFHHLHLGKTTIPNDSLSSQKVRKPLQSSPR